MSESQLEGQGGLVAKIALFDRTLPLDLPVPAAQPSGDVMDTSKPYTLPLNNEIALCRCVGSYTETDRKLWATLVALAWDNLGTKSIHEANARDIARLFQQLKGARNGSTWVMDSARRLLASRLDWEDEEEEGTAALLSGLRIKKVSGSIFYQFSDFLIEKLLDNKRFSRLRLHFMIGLSGKYSVSLYIILEAAANLRRPVIELSIDELRDRLSVPVGKLKLWGDLYRFAIAPAIKQINDNPAAAGFSVEYETIKRGRAFVAVRFTITKSETRLVAEDGLVKRVKKVTKKPAPPSGQGMPQYQIDDALAVIRREAQGLDAYYVLREFEAFAKASETPIKNPLGALTMFARKKREKEAAALF